MNDFSHMLEASQQPLKQYAGFVMNGSQMAPTIKEGDHIVADIEQRAIISGEIYIFHYRNVQVVCRLLLDRDTVKFVFDAVDTTVDEAVTNIDIIGRIVEIKTLDES